MENSKNTPESKWSRWNILGLIMIILGIGIFIGCFIASTNKKVEAVEDKNISADVVKQPEAPKFVFYPASAIECADDVKKW